MGLFKRKKQEEFMETSEVIKDIKRKIPEYKGYRDLEDRLETDKQFRSYIVKQLKDISNDFAEIVGKLIEVRMLNAWGTCDKILKEIKEIEKKVRAPDYRHTTFFENPRLEGLDISVIYILESEAFKILDDIKVIGEEILGYLREANYENIDQLISQVFQLTNNLIKLLNDRIELIASFEIIGF